MEVGKGGGNDSIISVIESKIKNRIEYVTKCIVEQWMGPGFGGLFVSENTEWHGCAGMKNNWCPFLCN